MSRVKASRQHRMVVVRHRPVLKWATIVGALTGSIGGAIFAYQYGLATGGKNHNQLATEVAAQQRKIIDLEAEKNTLQQQLTNINTGLEIDRKANESVRQQLMTIRTTLQNTLAENEMYRSILDPQKDADKGPALDKWSLSATNVVDQYTFKVIAKQLVNPGDWIKGNITLKITGSQNGTESVLDFTDIVVGTEKTLPVRFRYFQTVSGTFALPKEFTPRELTLVLKVDGKKKETVTKTFAWEIQ